MCGKKCVGSRVAFGVAGCIWGLGDNERWGMVSVRRRGGFSLGFPHD